MKKFFSMMAVLAAMFTFAACTESSTDEPQQNTKLAAPVVELDNVGETGFSIKWNAVQGADSYQINMKGKNYTTKETSYTFENLNRGEYSVRVKATGKGYTDSDFSNAVVANVTGASQVDWFTQTLTLVEDNEANAAEGLLPCNAADFSWKGTGIADLKYGLFVTEQIAGWDDANLVASMNTLGESTNAIIEQINAEGFAYVFTELPASTSFTLCTWVVNADGMEFIARNEVTTAELVVTDDVKSWLGTWTGYTEKVLAIEDNYAIKDQRTDFTVTITAHPQYSNLVVVDGFSEAGAQNPAIAMVEVGEDGANRLGILNQQVIGDLADGSGTTWYITWMSYVSGIDNFLLGEFPTHILTLGEADGVMYQDTLSDGPEFTVIATDILAWDGNTSLSFLQNENGQSITTFKAGPIKGFTKVAEPTAATAMKTPKSLSLSPLAKTVAVPYTL